MKFEIRDGLPFIAVQLTIKDQVIVVDNVLLDTGSATSLFSVDFLSEYGIAPEANDQIRRVVGIGGHEYVFEKQINEIKIDNLQAKDTLIQIGAMDYGFKINGILGSNLLIETNAMIDFKRLTIKSHG